MLKDSNIYGVVAGAFDCYHIGYNFLFKEAKQHCDHLTILLHLDPSSERIEKIPPFNHVLDRKEILMSIKYIDDVIIYETEKDLLKYLERGKFDVRFLDNDYKNKNYTGKDLNIPIHWINRDHGWSTTNYKIGIYKQIHKHYFETGK